MILVVTDVAMLAAVREICVRDTGLCHQVVEFQRSKPTLPPKGHKTALSDRSQAGMRIGAISLFALHAEHRIGKASHPSSATRFNPHRLGIHFAAVAVR